MIASVIANTVEFGISLVICLAIAIATGIAPTVSILLIPLVMVMQIVLVMWVALVLSSVSVFVADISHLYQIFLRMLLFITPVFYSMDILGQGAARQIALLNPLTHLMTYTRQLIIEGGTLPWSSIAIFLSVNVLLLTLSLVLFRNREPIFAEYL